ncbi:C-3 sterol dehydrogenase/C-4 decarboxylase family protein [Dothidotthia symphoricarpi CBS 119687]|uniref:C-3 sterol dehydrogenase/C-4 decarboxylase family protein n=1 Tax=Dothidotthia symphoricarpi CBS 119687 TaxID=1392245 RepID=A0A6A6A6C3_9PLEO|nr:C-3 sterol dehydrogenase/C-4 decarboxylase family protein [Dothidotthia symphoricarpi CBS 119687]KAF2126703.1 C-3 sterol dehydrogenase/C-4 decarboxylase family protein [Dothidotthia symphoricarpi CBS 119687]
MAMPPETPLLNPNTIVLVTGGSGGLASQILHLFSQQGSQNLHSIDLRQPSHHLNNVTYHVGDLTDSTSMHLIFQAAKPNIVIHTASPKFDSANHVMHKVNIEGTKTLLQIAKECGTRAFVYTSSASVISDATTDLENADESYPVNLNAQQPEFYTYTKAVAETYVLSQNCRAQGTRVLSCAIRPSGIFGVGDLVVLPGILDAFDRGQTRVQIGDNKNLFDFTANINVAHAHYLAAVALDTCQTGDLPGDDEKVDGEAFFITNDEPRCFWDFTRLVWGYAGDKTQPGQVWVITRTWALLLAGVVEWVFWGLRMGEPPLTRTKVRLSCMTRCFCVDKAKKRLGYRPLVGLEEGLKQAVEDCVRRRLMGRSVAQVDGSGGKEKGQ